MPAQEKQPIGPASVAVDVCCISCGYNLRTMSLQGDCPECGYAVVKSVQEFEFARWRVDESDADGMTLLGVAVFGWLLLIVPVLVGRFNGIGHGAMAVFAMLGTLVSIVNFLATSRRFSVEPKKNPWAWRLAHRVSGGLLLLMLGAIVVLVGVAIL